MVSSDQRVKGGISLVHQTYYLVHRGVMDFFGEPLHAIIRLFAQTIICCCALSPRLEAFAE